jgi:hypothetical protein
LSVAVDFAFFVRKKIEQYASCYCPCQTNIIIVFDRHYPSKDICAAMFFAPSIHFGPPFLALFHFLCESKKGELKWVHKKLT